VARRAYYILAPLPALTPEAAEPPMRVLVEELGYSTNQVFGILRAAVTGQTVSPPLFESMEIVGKAKVLERLEKAIRILESLP
jgi:glutamyl-tRNA synthetase